MNRVKLVLVSTLLLIILFGGCSSNFTETTKTNTEKIITSVTAEKTDSISHIESEVTTSDTNENYTLQYVYPENTSKEQTMMASQLYSQIDNSKLHSALEKNISEFVSKQKLDDVEEDKVIYEVKYSEYYNDFDGNGKNEIFLYRSVYLPGATPDNYYRDLWYTDGENVRFVMESEGRNDFSGVIALNNGPDLFYCVPEIVMGAPLQVANCYTVSDGKPCEYVLPDNNQYFAFDKGDEVSNIYICFWNDEDSAWEIAENVKTSDGPLQTFDWVNGEIKIVSGYGAE